MEKERKILVIDNDPFQRISCRVMLRGVEFVVHFCEDGESAIGKILREEFEVIITNIALPNKYCGLTLLQEIHAIQPKADIIVMADRPSIWDARESLRLGASGYIERPFTPECLMNVAQKTFDKKGWIVRKARIDQFRDCIVRCPDDDDPLIYYKNGSWARHLSGCIWEVGYDVKHWCVSDRRKNGSSAYLEGDLRRVDGSLKSRLTHDHALSIEVSAGLSTIVAGKPYARVSSSAGMAYALQAPMTGTVEEVNEDANNIMVSCCPEAVGTDWQLWLARIQAKEWKYGTMKDVEEGRAVGMYEHIACFDINAMGSQEGRPISHLSNAVGR